MRWWPIWRLRRVPTNARGMSDFGRKADLTRESRSSPFDRCCRKTILLTRARKIDSRLGADAQFRFENPIAPIRLLHIPILQIVRGDFFDSIGQKRSWLSRPR